MKKSITILVFIASTISIMAQPSWVDNQGEEYDDGQYVYGFGISSISKEITVEESREKSLINAKKNLSERIYLNVESKSLSSGGFNSSGTESSYQEKFETVTASFSQVEVIGLNKKEYQDKQRYYTLVYASIDMLTTEYSKKWKSINEDINESFENASTKSKSDPAVALKICNGIFKKIDDRTQIETILFSLGYSSPTEKSKSYRDVKALINDIENFEIINLRDLSFNLVNNIKNQLATIDGEVLVKPFNFQKNNQPSELSKVLSDEIENQTIRNTEWRVARRDTYNPNGSYNFLKGSYKISNGNATFRIILDNPAEGIIASYQVDIPVSVLDNTGLNYIPKQKIAFKKEKLNPSGLKIDVWTNKGQKDLLFVEDDVLKIGFKANMPCYVRVIYFLAPEPGQSTGDKVLLIDNYKIDLEEVDKGITYPEEFVCSEPFGLETMQVFAKTQPFDPLNTKSEYGYEFIVDNQDMIRNKSMTKRGMKKQDYSTQVQLSFTTMKK